MLTIYKKILYEPAVFIGLLASIIALIFKISEHNLINYQDIAEVLLPLATGTAVRKQTVSKQHHQEVINGKN